MTTPDFLTFKKLAKKGNLVAVSRELPADLETPVSCFFKLAAKEKHAFLLESAEQEEKVGRYSFIGIRPRKILTAKKGGRPILKTLEDQLSRARLANAHELPAFCGGCVGYLSYENVEEFEDIRLKSRKGPQLPLGIFFLAQELVLFDHFRKTLSVVSIADISKKESLRSSYKKSVKRIDFLAARLQKPLRLSRSPTGKVSRRLSSNMSPKQFHQRVNRIKEYIRAGDCIQVVLSQRFSFPPIRDDFQIYRALRSINPSPYMFYFRSGKFRLIGSSPEVLVKKTGRTAEVRPIAGTRPRGKTSSQDAGYAENLRKSPKEMAEHLMLVDLGRNDLGRVCQFDSIRVQDFARIERYSHVMHLVSDVLGKLKKGKTAFDLLRATFPAGTVSGAPKIRAMQIINELEMENRGPYAGCLGYFSFNQDMDMCITIRTLVLDGKKIYLQAGAGIVKDSHPKREYQETVNKANALLKAIAHQGKY